MGCFSEYSLQFINHLFQCVKWTIIGQNRHKILGPTKELPEEKFKIDGFFPGQHVDPEGPKAAWRFYKYTSMLPLAFTAEKGPQGSGKVAPGQLRKF